MAPYLFQSPLHPIESQGMQVTSNFYIFIALAFSSIDHKHLFIYTK